MVSIERLPDVRTRGGARVTAWMVPCVQCGRKRSIRRKQHAIRLGAMPCKKCAAPDSHPREEVGGIRVSFFNKFRIGARNRGLPWEIDIGYAVDCMNEQAGKCAITGLPLVFCGDFDRITASLDRIDSSVGYVPGNVQWVHKTINMMKGSLASERFVAWCVAVADKEKW